MIASSVQSPPPLRRPQNTCAGPPKLLEMSPGIYTLRHSTPQRFLTGAIVLMVLLHMYVEADDRCHPLPLPLLSVQRHAQPPPPSPSPKPRCRRHARAQTKRTRQTGGNISVGPRTLLSFSAALFSISLSFALSFALSLLSR